MKFIALACLAVFGFANLDQEKVQAVAHKSIADLPDKVHKTYQFFKPHLDETGAVIKKNVKDISVKAKPHYEKAKTNFKVKQAKMRKDYVSKKAEFKRKYENNAKALKNLII